MVWSVVVKVDFSYKQGRYQPVYMTVSAVNISFLTWCRLAEKLFNYILIRSTIWQFWQLTRVFDRWLSQVLGRKIGCRDANNRHTDMKYILNDPRRVVYSSYLEYIHQQSHYSLILLQKPHRSDAIGLCLRRHIGKQVRLRIFSAHTRYPQSVASCSKGRGRKAMW